MTKIKDRVNKKINLISDKLDISSVGFTNSTLESLLSNKNIEIDQYHDMVEFKSSNDRGSIKFYAYKDEGYKVELQFAFAKIFDFENDALLTSSQMDRLQKYVDDFIEPENENNSEETNDLYFKYGVKPSNFY